MKNKIMGSFVCLIAMLVLCETVRAQGNAQWEFAGWYGGGCYPNVAFDPVDPNKVYLVSDVAGILKSEDRGDHWEFITQGLKDLVGAFIAVAPSDPKVLYAGTKGGLYVSRDAGKKWDLCDRYNKTISFVRPANYRSIAIAAHDPGKLFIGTAAGQVLMSEDFGKNWNVLARRDNPSGKKEPVTALVLTEGEFLFAGAKSGLQRFSFKKSEWESLVNGPATASDLYLMSNPKPVLFVAGGKTLFFSRDAGETWEQTVPVPNGTLQRVSADQKPDGSIRIAAVWEQSWNGGVLLSDDMGRSWTSADQNMYPDKASDPTRAWQRNGGKTTAIKISPHDPKVMFRTDWWGVWRSDDGGASWSEKILGAPNTVGSDIAIDGKGQIYIATMDNGLLKSNDAGKTYQALFPSKGYSPSINGHVWRVVTSKDGKRIIATSSPWGENVNQVALSDNGGESFSITREGLPLKRPKKNTVWGEGYPRALAVDPQNPDLVYLGMDGDEGGGLFISRNGGKTWTLSPGQPDSRRIYNALAVDPTDPKRIFWGACGKNGGVHRSEDGGLSWKRVFSDTAWVFDLAVAPDGTVYAGGDNRGPELYVSKDHGKKWKLLKSFEGSGTVEAITLDPKDPKRIAISTVLWSGGGAGGAIYLTVDGGKKWQNITQDLPPGTGAAAMAFNQDGSYLYLTRYAGSVYRLKL